MNRSESTKRPSKQGIRLAAIFCLLAGCVPQACLASSWDADFYNGLRARGLYWLAEKQALDPWQAGDLPADTRADLTIELAKTYAEWAVASPPDQRPRLWEKAHQKTAEFVRLNPNHRKRLLIHLQDALTWLAEGEVARLEATGRTDPNRFDQAKEPLRRSIRELDAISDQTEWLLREARLARTPSARTEWSVAELAGLDRHVGIEMARALRNQALCYPPQNEDYVNALIRALEQLDRPGVATGRDRLAWLARLDRIACLRLLGRGTACRQEMQAVLDAEPPDWVILRIEANRVRLILDEGDLAAALAAVEKGRLYHGKASQELDLAHLDVYLALWAAEREGKAPISTDSLTARMTDQVRWIREAHGLAPGRYAEMRVGRLLTTSQGITSAGPNLETLRMAAESFYRAGKRAEAVAAYDQAAAAAKASQAIDAWFEFAFMAAAIEQKAEHLLAACDRYRQLAEAMPQHARAAEAHRLAILCAAGLVREAGTTADRQRAAERYAALLSDHIAAWPDAPSAQDARFWYGQWLENQHDWQAAIAMYQSLSADSDHFEKAVRRLPGVYERLFGELSDPDERIQHVREATRFLQTLVTGPDGAWPSPWTPFQRAMALGLARIHLRHADEGPEYCRQVLTAALAEPDDGDPSWQASARALLAEALLAQGKIGDVAELSRQIPDGFLPMVDWIERATAALQHADDAQATAIADLVLQWADRLGSGHDGPDEATQHRIDRARAVASARLGDRAAALAIYARLVAANPTDGNLREEQARLLGTTRLDAELDAALKAWYELEQGSQPGGPRWFRARYARSELLVRCGRQDEAITLIRLTEALHPDLGGPPLRDAFRKLLDQISDMPDPEPGKRQGDASPHFSRASL